MKKVKEFLESPKKTAILGIIGSLLIALVYILPDIQCLFVFKNGVYIISMLMHIILGFHIGLIIYFIIILARFNKKNINIKIANWVLIISGLITLLINICNLNIIEIIFYIVTIPCFINILFNLKKKFLNNKVLLIFYVIHLMVFWINAIQYFNLFNFICVVLITIGNLLIIPYFYIFYELTKEVKKNGK